MKRALFSLVAVLASVHVHSEAGACSVFVPETPVAIPRKGATNVPTLVDVVLIGPNKGVVTLEGGGDNLTLPAFVSHGQGYDAVTGTRGEVVRYRPPALKNTTEYIVRLARGGTPIELTRFTTGTGYDKPSAVAPRTKSLSLTRVRYPLSEIGAGSCVFAEYHGFPELGWELASFPNTPADSTVHTLWLGAKTGGHDQNFVWIGKEPYAGTAPTGDKPLPVGFFHPYLDPTREYCFAVRSWGYGEATLPADSERVCATVTERSTPGAPPPATPTCPSAPACPADAGPAPGALPSGSSDGCALGSSHRGSAGAVAFVVALLALSRRRRCRGSAGGSTSAPCSRPARRCN